MIVFVDGLLFVSPLSGSYTVELTADGNTKQQYDVVLFKHWMGASGYPFEALPSYTN